MISLPAGAGASNLKEAQRHGEGRLFLGTTPFSAPFPEPLGFALQVHNHFDVASAMINLVECVLEAV